MDQFALGVAYVSLGLAIVILSIFALAALGSYLRGKPKPSSKREKQGSAPPAEPKRSEGTSMTAANYPKGVDFPTQKDYDHYG